MDKSVMMSDAMKYAWVLTGVLIVGNQTTAAQSVTNPDYSLQSFYIATHAVSDAAPYWFDYVLDVRIEESTARMTLLRVAPVMGCDGRITVSEAEATVPASEVTRLTKGLCSIRRQQVDRAVAEAKPKWLMSIDDSVSFGIVEKCNDREETIRLPFLETVDDKKLHRIHPKLYDLWNVYSRLMQAAFHGNPLEADYREPYVDVQRAAEPFIQELRSGAFDRGFAAAIGPGYKHKWHEVFEDYHGVLDGPVRTNGEVLDKDALGFLRCVLPTYPAPGAPSPDPW